MKRRSSPTQLKTVLWLTKISLLSSGILTSLLLTINAAETITPGLMKWEVYTNITGNSLANLIGNENFPDSPAEVRIVPAYEGPSSYGDSYGARISGFITPKESADYVFFIATDDNGELYLSTNESPDNKKLIARETVWSNLHEWTTSGGLSELASKRSDQFGDTEWVGPIHLEAGKRYYTELLYKQGTGGNLGGVTMIKVGAPSPANGSPALSGDLIAALVDPDAGPPSVLQQPQSITVAQGGTANFTVTAIGAKPLTYQWQRGGVNIPGATGASFTVNNAGSTSFGAYSVVVSNSLGSATSQVANLNVTGLPTVLFVHSSGGPNASDSAAMNRLQGLGWQTVPIAASASTANDATGRDLVVVSSTVSSGEVAAKFKLVATPVLNWEAAVEDDFSMTENQDGVTRGVTGGQTEIEIAKADHPMAGGLPAGPLAAVSSAQEISWGVPAAGATAIATLAGDPTRAAIYVYDKGIALIDGTPAPATRIHFMLSDNTFSALTEAGLKLFDAAVLYATGGGPSTPFVREYSVGLNFGANEFPNKPNAASLASTNVAGFADVAQANWNNLSGASGTNTTIVADAGGTNETTGIQVQWSSNNTWSSTGRGEENNAFPTNSPNWALYAGYLDTIAASTSRVSIANIPARLTQNGYDVYVYTQGGVGGKGGSYRVVDTTTGTVLHDYVRALAGTNLSQFVEVPQNLGATAGTGNRSTNFVFGVGNYIVFRGLTSSNITVEAATGTVGTYGIGPNPRAPINAIQLVAPSTAPDFQDVTRPGDPIVSSQPPARSPTNEQVPNAIDNNVLTKYLNFGADTDQAAPFVGPVGFTVTPSAGPSSVRGLALTSANDAPERDPSSFRLEGSNDGTNFTLIAEGTIPAFSARFIRQEILFTNQLFQVNLSGAGERPVVNSTGTGSGYLTISSNQVSYNISYTNLSGAATAAHIHGPASPEESANPIVPFPSVSGAFGALTGSLPLTESQRSAILAGKTYVNIHTGANAGGEIRGQVVPATFTSYRLMFPTVANATTAVAMQIAEVELLGTVERAAAPPAISISKSDNGFRITYEGTLYSATQITGPFTVVTGATSPYTTTAEGTARFFIAR